jgi:hypothetical protein
MKKILKEDAISRLEKHNPNIKLIGEYINLTQKTYFKCKICGNIKFSSFYDMLTSSRKLGCLKCEKRSKNKKEKSRTKSHEQYVLDVYNIWNNLIEIIGQYDMGMKKIKVKCNKCNHIWNPEAKALLAKHGCPICGHEKNRNSTVKKHSEYVNEVAIKHNNNLNVIGTYISADNKILIKCNKCQYERLSVARNILNGRGCPKCRLNKGESLIKNILDELKINYKPQYVIEKLKTAYNGTPIFDFAIFDENNKLNTIIEYDGIQHFKEIKKWGGEKRLIEQQKIDEFKNNYCLKNNIRLIRIKYTEFKKINTDYIKHLLYE